MKKFLKESEWFSLKDYRHLPVFIGFVVLIIGLTVALTLASNGTQGGQSGASGYNCIPLPGCYRNHICPEIINYKIPNFKWCLPSPSPTPSVLPTPPSGCNYVPVVCPAIACIIGQPCPTCPPPKLVCPSPIPTPTCRPRPACLDAIPRCMIPETSDMCPKIPTPTPNQTGCNTDSDCQNGATCMTGTIIANQPVHKVCVQKGQAIPL